MTNDYCKDCLVAPVLEFEMCPRCLMDARTAAARAYKNFRDNIESDDALEVQTMMHQTGLDVDDELLNSFLSQLKYGEKVEADF